MSRWDFARALFDEHFRPLLEAGFELERLDDAEAYWKLHDSELLAHFPHEIFFHLPQLRSEHERAGQFRLAQASGASPLGDFSVIRKGARVIGMFCGEQQGEGMYRMRHANIHPEHRRKGIYGTILRATIAYTAALGFDTITSEHVPCNNAILIAKLRAGFHIYSLELDAGPGISVVLRYFHNPEYLAAYELRCGMASLTPKLSGSALGAWPQFCAQALASKRR